MSLANNSLSERILDIVDSTFCFYALCLTDWLGWSNMANHYIRPAILKACGFSIGAHCQIRPGMVIHSHKHRVTIGDYSAINKQVLFDAPEPVIIGKYCDIGCNVAFVTGNHILDTDFTGKRPMKPSGPIVLEDYVWIGAQVTILEGVTIGRGSVVAAGSVVTKSVPPNTLVGGVPAKVLKTINGAG